MNEITGDALIAWKVKKSSLSTTHQLSSSCPKNHCERRVEIDVWPIIHPRLAMVIIYHFVLVDRLLMRPHRVPLAMIPRTVVPIRPRGRYDCWTLGVCWKNDDDDECCHW